MEKDSLLQTRLEMRKEIDRNKRELLDNFERMKKQNVFIILNVFFYI